MLTKHRNSPSYSADIEQAIRVMRSGGIILYPTDTVWGIGCDATNADAVARVYALKQREDSKSMLVLVDSVAKIEHLVGQLPDVAYDMIELSIRPLTIIYQGASGVASNLLGEHNSLGIRSTKEEFSQSLCRQFARPIVSTSANISGEPTPMLFKDIDPRIVAGVDYVVGYRQSDGKISEPSQIIALGPNGEVKVLRM